MYCIIPSYSSAFSAFSSPQLQSTYSIHTVYNISLCMYGYELSGFWKMRILMYKKLCYSPNNLLPRFHLSVDRSNRQTCQSVPCALFLFPLVPTYPIMYLVLYPVYGNSHIPYISGMTVSPTIVFLPSKGNALGTLHPDSKNSTSYANT